MYRGKRITDDPCFVRSKNIDTLDPCSTFFKSIDSYKKEMERKKKMKKLQWQYPISKILETVGALKKDALAKPRFFSCGTFWGNLDVPEKHVQLLINELAYFTEDRLRKNVVPFVTRKDEVSLRLLGWLITNYVKEYPVIYVVNEEIGGKQISRTVNVLQSYLAAMKQHHRRHFDPFRRNDRLYFSVDDVAYETTIGQLLFLKWVAEEHVIHYARTNRKEIEEHMLLHTDAKREEREKEAALGIPHRRSEFIKVKRQGISMFSYDQVEEDSDEESEEEEDECMK